MENLKLKLENLIKEQSELKDKVLKLNDAVQVRANLQSKKRSALLNALLYDITGINNLNESVRNGGVDGVSIGVDEDGNYKLYIAAHQVNSQKTLDFYAKYLPIAKLIMDNTEFITTAVQTIDREYSESQQNIDAAIRARYELLYDLIYDLKREYIKESLNSEEGFTWGEHGVRVAFKYNAQRYLRKIIKIVSQTERRCVVQAIDAYGNSSKYLNVNKEDLYRNISIEMGK